MATQGRMQQAGPGAGGRLPWARRAPRWPQQFIMFKIMPAGGALKGDGGAEAAGSWGNSGLVILFFFFVSKPKRMVRNIQYTGHHERNSKRNTHSALTNPNRLRKTDLTCKKSLYPCKVPPPNPAQSYCYRHHSLRKEKSSDLRARWSSLATV